VDATATQRRDGVSATSASSASRPKATSRCPSRGFGHWPTCAPGGPRPV